MSVKTVRYILQGVLNNINCLGLFQRISCLIQFVMLCRELLSLVKVRHVYSTQATVINMRSVVSL